MPRFGRTGSGKWHVVGTETCQYSDRVDDETTFTELDIAAYAPDENHDQRLAVPDLIEVSDADLCGTCRSALERRQGRRKRLITLLKRNVPYRGIDWTTEEEGMTCYWCRATEPEGRSNERLGSVICPACASLYDTPLGDPDTTPDEDRRPPTPADPIEPIVFGVDIEGYDPTDLVGTNRPVIEGRPRQKYAALLCRVGRTGHALAPEGLAALAEIRDDYADRAAAAEAHASDVAFDVDPTAWGVELDGIAPADLEWVAGRCTEVVSDPANWYRVGWSGERDVYSVPRDDGIPGSDPVAEAFVPLHLHSGPSPTGSGDGTESSIPGTGTGGVDVASIERITEPGRFERGRQYHRSGNVTEITRVDDAVEATVVGSRAYTVRLTVEDGAFVQGRCTCPDDANPCKHMVAAFLASDEVEPVRGAGDSDLDDVLRSASAAELRALLREAATEDISLRKWIYERLGGD